MRKQAASLESHEYLQVLLAFGRSQLPDPASTKSRSSPFVSMASIPRVAARIFPLDGVRTSHSIRPQSILVAVLRQAGGAMAPVCRLQLSQCQHTGRKGHPPCNPTITVKMADVIRVTRKRTVVSWSCLVRPGYCLVFL